MNQRLRRSTITLLVCLAGGLPLPLSSQTSVTSITQSWASHWNDKQLEATLALYAPDAVFLTAEGDRVTGQSAIRALFKKGLDSADPAITFHRMNSSASGDLAYDSGEYDETLTFTGNAPAIVTTDARNATPVKGTKMAFHGNYLIVFHRQPDGRWLIAQHMWTGAPVAGKP
jgi:ketosteroid isomerase-like protein